MPNANEQLTSRLYAGKAALRRDRQRASLDEKFLELWFLQRLYVDLASVRRRVEPWQQPWDIRSDVRETVVFGEGEAEAGQFKTTGVSSPSIQSRWLLVR